MKLIPLSKNSKKNKGKYFAQVDDEDFEWLNQYNWCVEIHRGKAYASRGLKINGKWNSISLHKTIMGISDGRIIDHADRNPLNCQRQNLRFCTFSENSANRSFYKNKSSIYMGVSRKVDVKNGKTYSYWGASIAKNNVKKHIGYFNTEEEAALAYNKMAIELHGEFANLNIILDSR